MGAVIWFAVFVCITVAVVVMGAPWYLIALHVFLDVLALIRAVKALGDT
jgi:hypothetical protein